MALTAPVNITATIRGAYTDKFKVEGVEGDTDLLTVLDYLITSVEAGGGKVYIDSDWVIKGGTGIEVTMNDPGLYEVNIPEGVALESLQTRIIDNETELDEDGNMVVNIGWNTTEFNQGYITALTPYVVFLDETGNQLTPAELGINVTTTVASGITSTTIGILGSLDVPFSVKLIF